MTSAASQRRSADLRAQELETVIPDIGSHLPLRAIPAELSARGIEPHRGGQWQAASVRRVMLRAGMPVGVAIDVRCAVQLAEALSAVKADTASLLTELYVRGADDSG